jgi:hypothetical protein
MTINEVLNYTATFCIIVLGVLLTCFLGVLIIRGIISIIKNEEDQ